MSRHRISFALTFSFFLFPFSFAVAEEVDWRSDYNAARKEAAEKGRPIVLDFGFESCVHCRKLDATTFHDGDVIKRINAKFVALRIDIERPDSRREAGSANVPHRRLR